MAAKTYVLRLDPEQRKLVAGVPGCRDFGLGGVRVPHAALPLLKPSVVPEAAVSREQLISSPVLHGLYAHQVDALHRMFASQRRLLLCDEMGTGKTRTIWSAMQLFTPPRAKILIVAPKYLETTWRRETVRGDRRPDFYSCTGIDIRNSPVLSESKWPSRETAPGVYFIHHEILHDWQSRIARHYWDAIIFDEVHMLASPRSKRGRAALAVANSANMVVAATGTPLVNKPADLWVPLTLVCGGGEWGTFFEFRVRYCGAIQTSEGGTVHWKDMAPTHVEELRARMAPFYLRREMKDLEEMSDMPAFVRDRIDVDVERALREKQHAALEGMGADAILRALRGDRRDIAAVTRMRQATSRAKLGATLDRMQQLLDAGQHVVIFTVERVTAGAIADAVPLGIPRWEATGDVDAAARAQMVDEFETTKGPGVIVATYGALSQGVTLVSAAHVILHDLPWTFKDALQAEARIRRIGQTRATRAYWMIAAGTIDELIASVLLDKAAAISLSLGIEDATKAAEELDLAGLEPTLVIKHYNDALARHYGG